MPVDPPQMDHPLGELVELGDELGVGQGRPVGGLQRVVLGDDLGLPLLLPGLADRGHLAGELLVVVHHPPLDLRLVGDRVEGDVEVVVDLLRRHHDRAVVLVLGQGESLAEGVHDEVERQRGDRPRRVHLVEVPEALDLVRLRKYDFVRRRRHGEPPLFWSCVDRAHWLASGGRLPTRRNTSGCPDATVGSRTREPRSRSEAHRRRDACGPPRYRWRWIPQAQPVRLRQRRGGRRRRLPRRLRRRGASSAVAGRAHRQPGLWPRPATRAGGLRHPPPRRPHHGPGQPVPGELAAADDRRLRSGPGRSPDPRVPTRRRPPARLHGRAHARDAGHGRAPDAGVRLQRQPAHRRRGADQRGRVAPRARDRGATGRLHARHRPRRRRRRLHRREPRRHRWSRW